MTNKEAKTEYEWIVVNNGYQSHKYYSDANQARRVFLSTFAPEELEELEDETIIEFGVVKLEDEIYYSFGYENGFLDADWGSIKEGDIRNWDWFFEDRTMGEVYEKNDEYFLKKRGYA